MAETVEFPERGRHHLTEDEAGYARRQAELFGGQVRWISQRYGPWGELVRGGYVPDGGAYGVIGEALTGWWLTARRSPDWPTCTSPSPSAPPASPDWP